MPITRKLQQLQNGDAAPQFKSRDTFGNELSLKNCADKHLLVVFMRYAGCPWCNLSVHRLTLEYPMIVKQDCRVVVFMQSTASKIKQNIYDKHKSRPQYPIIPDLKQAYYHKYGVQTSVKAAAKSIKDIPYWLKSITEYGVRSPQVDANLLLVPATFLISPGDQKIIKAEYGSSFYEHGTFTEIYEPLIFR